MQRPIVLCAVISQRVRRRNSRSNKQTWCSLATYRHLLIGQLDAALAALPCNDAICPNCYKCLRRLSLSPPPPSQLDG